jgi:Resolvase, N terminal domain
MQRATRRSWRHLAEERIKNIKPYIPLMRPVRGCLQWLALDDAKIVDILDAHNASFVSVTQQFNTTTSMGRLTLNMLLSFAQFEREIAGERIRDKIAASKKKGMWMGGNVPLGYDVRDRKLIINEPEASTVWMIFRRYAELGSVGRARPTRKTSTCCPIVRKNGGASAYRSMQ